MPRLKGCCLAAAAAGVAEVEVEGAAVVEGAAAEVECWAI